MRQAPLEDQKGLEIWSSEVTILNGAFFLFNPEQSFTWLKKAGTVPCSSAQRRAMATSRDPTATVPGCIARHSLGR